MPSRRDLMLSAAALAVGGKRALAQRRVPRLGFVEAGSPETKRGLLDALREGLRALGWYEGSNIAILARWAEGHHERLPELVDEVIWSGIDVLVTGAAPAAIAAGRVTRTIPVVLVGEPDPVAFGLADSLAQPGGNVTGLSSLSLNLVDRQFELLHETVPAMARVAALAISQEPSAEQRWRYVRAAADRLRLTTVDLEAATPEALERAFVLLHNYPCDGLWVAYDGSNAAEPARVVQLATAAHLPAIYPSRGFAAAGGLMSYGADFADLYRRAAGFVDKILRGANPGDLPFETPDKFDLVLNSKAAAGLELKFPKEVLDSADEVIAAAVAAPPVAASPGDEKGGWVTIYDKGGE